MEVTLLGTRSPVPTTERGGTGLLVSIGDEPIFVDFASGADLLPHRDLATMRERAESVFDGEVIVGEDNLAVTP